jgi:sensor histidine kinase YesM
MMGYSFFVKRNYNINETVNGISTTSTINADDISDYKLEFYQRSIKDYNFLLEGIDQYGTSTYNDTETIDVFGSQNVDVSYTLSNLYTATYDIADTPKWTLPSSGTGSSAFTTSGILTIIGNDSKDSYKKSLGIEQPFKVSLTIMGIEKLKPFQFITLGTGINDALDGNIIRPSSLEYDLEKNLINVEGYFI